MAQERHIENDLKDVKGRCLTMAGYVEEAIERAIHALQTRNSSRLGEVFEFEARINQMHIEVDNACLNVLARRSPVAADLRLVLAIIKINTDLERMGDQSVNLAKNATHYLTQPAVDLAQNLPQMADLVKIMVRDSLDAFVNSNTKLAQKVLESDDAVDALKKSLGALFIERMRTVPAQIEGALNLLLITRNLERMGDHATNIAEDVIFACTGKDVRHGSHKD